MIPLESSISSIKTLTGIDCEHPGPAQKQLPIPIRGKVRAVCPHPGDHLPVTTQLLTSVKSPIVIL